MKQNFNNFPLYTKINSVYIHTIEGGNEVAGENKEKRYEKGDTTMRDINGTQINTGDRVESTGRGSLFSDGQYVVLGVDVDNDTRVIVRSVTPDPDYGYDTASVYGDEIVKA